MSSDWNGELTAARADYLEAQNSETAAGRLLAARRFRAIIDRFRHGGPAAVDALERAAVDSDPWRAESAVRIYSALDDPAVVSRFITFFIRVTSAPGGPSIDARHLRRLGRERPVAFDILDRVKSVQRVYVIFPMFRYPNDEARALLDELLADQDDFALREAMNGIAGWGEPDLIRKVLAAPPIQPPADLESPIEGSPQALWPKDVRPHAAFLLAQLGEAGGLEALARFAADRDGRLAAEAVTRLGWLAHPTGIPSTAALLRSRSNDAVSAAIEAAADYAAAALAPALIDLIERRARARNTIPDDAINVLATGIGDVTLPDEISSVIGVEGHHVGESGRRQAAQLLRTAVGELDPALRYRQARPLTLVQLAEDLLSRHDGPRATAAYQLRAVTGEDHGADPDDDIIANVPAIDAWRARATRPGPVPPGGWAFLGRPLPPPPRP